uniref:Uncharacterized protein n=1 Tax=Caenorhabditis japonica TaxID=281687 RepID=A0A8R1E6P2_CAEJA
MRGSNVTKNFSIRSHLENRDRKNKSVDENSVLGSKRITVTYIDSTKREVSKCAPLNGANLNSSTVVHRYFSLIDFFSFPPDRT